LSQTLVGCLTTYYDYNAEGERVKKTGSDGTLHWHGPGGEVLEETDLNGVLKNEYVFFGGKRVARYNPTNGYSYYFSDHLGSANVVTNALGQIKEESDFYPFGGERIVTDSGIDNRYKFTGKERDPETGCDYFGARYYCNPIGRFITPDWAVKPTAVPYAHFGNPQSLNLYSYVQNNPTTMGDADGHGPPSLVGAPFICLACMHNGAAFISNPKQYAIGLLQAAKSYAYHTAMFAGGPVTIMADHLIGEPKSFQPKNESQAAGKSFGTGMLVLGSMMLGGPKGTGGAAAETQTVNLPAFDGKTTVGVLHTSEGGVYSLTSGTPELENYAASGHVEGKAALIIRRTGSSGGTQIRRSRRHNEGS
jgi:RHS repeat-associated protein